LEEKNKQGQKKMEKLSEELNGSLEVLSKDNKGLKNVFSDLKNKKNKK